MPSPHDSKENLLEHSKAKVTLLHTYLVNYLSVIANDGYTDRIRIFDMFCGRGIYDNEEEGSPLVIVSSAKNLYFSRLARKARIPRIDCYFSDENVNYVEKVLGAIASKHLHYSEMVRLVCVPTRYENKIHELIKYYWPETLGLPTA